MNNWLLISILIIVIIFNLNLSTTENFDNNDYKAKINSLIKKIENNIPKLQKIVDKRKNNIDEIRENGERKQNHAKKITNVKFADKKKIKKYLIGALS